MSKQAILREMMVKYRYINPAEWEEYKKLSKAGLQAVEMGLRRAEKFGKEYVWHRVIDRQQPMVANIAATEFARNLQ